MDRKIWLSGAVAAFTVFSGGVIANETATTSLVSIAGQPATETKHDEKAIEILDSYVEKIGGEKLIGSIESTKVTGTISVPMAGLSGTMTMQNKLPGMMSMVIEIAGFGKQESGYDGQVGWSSDPMSGPRLMTDEEIAGIADQTDPTAALKYRELYPMIEYAGETNFEGSKAHKIKMVDETGKVQYQFYNISTGLMVGQESTEASPMGELNVIAVMSEYKEFGGMKMPTKIVQKMGPQQVIMEIKTAEMNNVDDSAFELPAAIQALVEASKDG
ncbi:MAG: hypothetical protein AB8F26_03150 [Phycisphaerales bacterium]